MFLFIRVGERLSVFLVEKLFTSLVETHMKIELYGVFYYITALSHV